MLELELEATKIRGMIAGKIASRYVRMSRDWHFAGSQDFSACDSRSPVKSAKKLRTRPSGACGNDCLRLD